MNVQFSNPRDVATVPNWPFGRQRCDARFEVEVHPTRGQRVARYTQNKTRTGWNKPKRTTYADRFAIVDGDDDKTYLLAHYRHSCVIVYSGNCIHSLAHIPPTHPRYNELVDIIIAGCPSTETVMA